MYNEAKAKVFATMMTEKRGALECLTLFTEKKLELYCASGSMQRVWMSREHASSPTMNTKLALLTAAIEAEVQEVAACDIWGASIQTQSEEVNQDIKGDYFRFSFS